jgi:ABC-type bacteriocin/lantibiotic exporter with double-glycine peptidase domain
VTGYLLPRVLSSNPVFIIMTLTLKISVALATEQRIRSSESKNAFISGVIEDAVKVHDPTRYNYLHQVWQQQTPSIFLDELRDVVAKSTVSYHKREVCRGVGNAGNRRNRTSTSRTFPDEVGDAVSVCCRPTS